MPWGVDLYGSGWEQSRITVASPAAGVDWEVEVPPGELWMPVSVTAKYQADLTGGTRGLRFFSIRDGVNWMAFSSNVEVGVAASVVIWCGVGSFNCAGTVAPVIQHVCIPRDFVLEPLDVFGARTLHMGVGDLWSAIQLTFKRWHTGPYLGVDEGSRN